MHITVKFQNTGEKQKIIQGFRTLGVRDNIKQITRRISNQKGFKILSNTTS